jgi:hypothetical protein
MATRANLIATYQGNPTLQNRYTQQEYLDMFGFGTPATTTTTPATTTPPAATTGVQNIIGQNLNRGGEGGGGIMELQQTYTPGAQPRGPKTDFNINPAFTLTGKGRLDPMGSDIDYFQSFRAQNDPRAFTSGLSIDNVGSDSRYFEEPSMINKGITAVKDFFSGIGTPKVRGTLGTRLANQPRLPLPSAIMAYSRSPFNRDSKTFNPRFEGQLNYLEGQDGYIGRDQQSGLLKYGPESVLSGQNVISAFGTNDYVKQLDKYISKMEKRGTEDDVFSITNLSPFQLAKYNQAKAEKQKFIDSAIYKAQQEEIKKQQEAAFQAQLNETQRQQRIDDLQRIERAYREETGGQAGSYATGESGQQADGSYNDPFDPGGGEKDGGFIDGTNRRKYDDGGRVYLYNRLK